MVNSPFRVELGSGCVVLGMCFVIDVLHGTVLCLCWGGCVDVTVGL